MTETRLSHAYMLVGPDSPERQTAVLRLAAALLCPETGAPCMTCRDCRKVMAGVHPDVTVVERQNDDRGRLRQEILVGQIRAVTSDAYIAPNEADRKVYIIREADRMNTEAQNALLKALEEPPGHACFLLCTSAADALLPTVRSRCVRVDETDRGMAQAELSEHAQAFLRLASEGNVPEMTRFCLLRAKLTREEAEALIEEIENALCDILCSRRSNPGLSAAWILDAAPHLTRAKELLRRNISPRQVFGLLAVEFDNGDTNDRNN